MAKRLSEVAKRTPTGQILCPNCGGDDFETLRSWWKFLIGAMAPKSRVRCITCGRKYKRG